MLPSHPLFRRFENVLSVGGHALEWITDGPDFFLRPQHAPVEMIWCCLRRADYAKKLLDPCQFQKASRKVAGEINTGHVWRFWPHSYGCDLLFRSRYGLVRLEDVEELIRFDLEKRFFSPQRLLTPPTELRDIITSCEANIQKIRDVMILPAEERGWQSVKWPSGTHDELCLLIRAMGDIIRDPEHERFQWRYEIKPNFSAGISLQTPYRHSKIPDTALYEPFLYCLRSHFPVESDRMILYTAQGLQWKSLWPTVMMSSETPTQHERMEAHLLWREFLRGDF